MGEEPLPEGNGQGGRELREEEVMVSLASQALLWWKSSWTQPSPITIPAALISTLPGLAQPHCCHPRPIPHLPPFPGRTTCNWSRCVGPPPPPPWHPAGSRTSAQTKGGLNSILGAGRGPDLVAAVHSVAKSQTLAPCTSSSRQAERMGRAARDEANSDGPSRSCFAPSFWQQTQSFFSELGGREISGRIWTKGPHDS